MPSETASRISGMLGQAATLGAGLAAAYLIFSDAITGLTAQTPKQLSMSLADWSASSSCDFTIDVIPVALLLLLVALCAYYYKRSTRRVYLLDFACYKPPTSLQITTDMFLWGSKKFASAGHSEDGDSGFQQESLEFQRRISHKNGLSDCTYFPPALKLDPPHADLDAARDEAKMVLFGAIREVLNRTGLKPRDIDFLVLNCSLFSPTPSLTAMVINHFKMRSDIISYNLGGMGCSAGIIAIDLADRLLKLSPNKHALVLSTENITQNWYKGNERAMLIPNTLFRMGSTAVLLTNKRSERHRAKYELLHCVRVHLGADDTAYKCVYQREDEAGGLGVALTKDIVSVSAKALQRNLTLLGPLVLPVSEQAKLAWDWLMRALGGRKGKAYVPDFRKAFTHFCLHAGGRGVMEGLGGQLSLTRQQLEPSFSSLFWYGNTSSASYWYAFSYIEARQGMRKGDKIWQVGFGSGFKTNSAVWKALRSFTETRHEAWAHVKAEDTAKMWADLEAMGVRFVDDVMPPCESKKGTSSPENGKMPENGKIQEKSKVLVDDVMPPCKSKKESLSTGSGMAPKNGTIPEHGKAL